MLINMSSFLFFYKHCFVSVSNVAVHNWFGKMSCFFHPFLEALNFHIVILRNNVLCKMVAAPQLMSLICFSRARFAYLFQGACPRFALKQIRRGLRRVPCPPPCVCVPAVGLVGFAPRYKSFFSYLVCF